MSSKKSVKQNISLINALRGENTFTVEEEILIENKENKESSEVREGSEGREHREGRESREKHENKEENKEENDEEKENSDEKNNNTSEEDEEDDEIDVTKLISIEEIKERAKYIPLRLTYEERKSLRLVNSAINVSDYTNSIDIEFKSKSKKRHIQLQNICGFLSGVISASSYEEGQKVLQDRNFCDYETFLQVHFIILLLFLFYF